MATSRKVEDAGAVKSLSVADVDCLNAEKVGAALDMILHIQDDVVRDSIIRRPENVLMSTELGAETGVTNAKSQRSLAKSATFPSPGKAPGGESAHKSAMPTCDRTQSFPSSFKLVSAMKGGRDVEEGTPRKTKMSVSWAPDVYDPPVTSMSHSVKSNNLRSYFRNKRKDRQHKHKSRKGKSTTRDSSSEKKHQPCQPDPSCARLQTDTSIEKLPSDDCGESGALVVEGSSSSNSQDSKCGNSSFLRASLAKVLYSVAEV